MEDTTDKDYPKKLRSEISAEVEMAIPLLRGMDLIERCELPPEARRKTIDHVFKALSAIGCDQARGTGIFSSRDVDHAAPYLAMLTDKNIARHYAEPYSGIPESGARATERELAERAAATEQELQRQGNLLRQVLADRANPGFSGELFSEVADRYIKRLEDANGPRYDELKYLRHRKIVFIEICGDKPVDAYTRDELQHFVNECSWIPANISRRKGYRPERMLEYIEESKSASPAERGKTLSKSTLKNNYLGKIRTILEDGCIDAKVPFTISIRRISIPKRAAPPKKRHAPAAEVYNDILEAGLRSGVLADLLLPVLGLLTGRRIGILAHIRRENILRYNGVWICVPNSHEVIDDEDVVVPTKTLESLEYFVLPRIFEECGFTARVKKQPGFLFAQLMNAKDPADAAQKRMGRLFRSVGHEEWLTSTFHGLRHGWINNSRDLKIDTRLIRLQVGHELTSVHDQYGSLTPKQARELADAPLPEGIDWAILMGVDWEALAQKVHKGGRRKK